MSRSWGAEGFSKSKAHTLEGVVRKLSPKAKQAMYAAADKQLIARGTWDGCAFNAGSLEIADQGVHSFASAAELFEMKASDVQNFIQVWDQTQGSDEQATERLREAILKAGLFTEPGEKKAARVLRETVYKSQEERMKEEFDSLVSSLDVDCVDEMNEEQQALLNDSMAAAELLGV